MKKILFPFFVFITSFIQAQQLSQSSLYSINELALNPAVAGSESYIPLLISNRIQWANFKNAPTTQTFAGHGGINNHGIGLNVTNFSTAPTGIITAQIAYSYRVKINEKTKLSFGIAPMFIQYGIAKEKIKLDESNDLTFNRVNPRTNIGDLNSGFLVKGKRFSVGVSGSQLLASRFRKGDAIVKERLRRQFCLTAYYDFSLTDKIKLSPMLIAKGIDAGIPYQADVNARLSFQDFFWLGMGYRASLSDQPGEAALLSLGVQKSGFVFAYAFDYSFSSIMPFSYGSHELLLSYRLNNKKSDGKTKSVVPSQSMSE